MGATSQSAIELLADREPKLRRLARRYSLCAADADDAYQRAVEIVLTKAPPIDGQGLARWMHVVTRHEALAVRRSRSRLLDPTGAGDAEPVVADPDLVASPDPGPEEALERRERVATAAERLRALKPDERRAIALQAAGCAYAEIQAITGWTYTKVNRCLAEGRASLRELRVGESG